VSRFFLRVLYKASNSTLWKIAISHQFKDIYASCRNVCPFASVIHLGQLFTSTRALQCSQTVPPSFTDIPCISHPKCCHWQAPFIGNVPFIREFRGSNKIFIAIAFRWRNCARTCNKCGNFVSDFLVYCFRWITQHFLSQSFQFFRRSEALSFTVSTDERNKARKGNRRRIKPKSYPVSI